MVPIAWFGLKFDEDERHDRWVMRMAITAPPTPSSVKIPAIAGLRPIVSMSEMVVMDVRKRLISVHRQELYYGDQLFMYKK